MDTLFIVDASSYLYSSYFALRNMTNDKGESTNALFGFIRSLTKLKKDFNPTHLIAVFDGPHNAKTRSDVYPAYKAHRQSMPLDLRYQIEYAKTYCQAMGIPMISMPNVEADDVMGSIACFAGEQGTHVYLCSGDKDLCQLVNDRIFILNTFKNNLIVGPAQVESIHGVPPKLFIDYLALIGDASDNVPGVPGFGPKTAAKLLLKYGSLNAILENPSLIAEDKKRNIFIRHQELAKISKQLVTLNTSLPISLDTNYYALKKPAYEELRNLYLTMGFKTLLKELDPPALQKEVFIETTDYLVVNDEETFSALLQTLASQPSICVMAQSSHSNPLKGRLIGISFAISPGKAWYVPANGLLGMHTVMKGLKELFANSKISFYGHNIKNDLQLLAHHNLEIQAIDFDTHLASYLLNSHSRQHSLESLMVEHFGKVKESAQELLGKGKNCLTLEQVDIQKLGLRCCEDADCIVRLKLLLKKQIEERNLGKLFYELELPLVQTLAAMERYGLFLDVPALRLLSDKISEQIVLLRKEIIELAGEEFNLNSPKQLIAVFEKLNIKSLKKTPKGQMRLDSEVLETIKDKYPIAGKLLEYRMLEKLRSTYVDTLPLEINPESGRIHCTFNQTVAATGRLSCQDPNLQNIPVRSELGREIRQAFCPQLPGWSFLAADYSQIELRLLAHFSEDPILLQAFLNHEDIHIHTASNIFNVPLKEVTKEQRYQAKAVNFGIIYGQQAFGLAQELNIDVKTAAEFIEKYFLRYTKVREFIEACKEQVRQTGKAVTLTGRERLIPEILSKNSHLRSLAERLAVNTPLQGTAADLIKMAMLKLSKAFPFPLKPLCHPNRNGMVLQIHDELIFEVADEDLPQVEKLVRHEMEEVLRLKVPLVVDINIGKNWKEC